ncbi:MAG: class I SAM-dependent methyltransferase [Mycolicibacterium sp.]|nr:class I SAM-dependent methyltransferase [Mycolicibacterium sp.]
MPTTWLDKLVRQTRRAGTFAHPHRAAVLLDNPVRRAVSNPRATVHHLALTGAERVLEVGPGPGFYSVAIAQRLTTGRLHLFDLQPQMLERARRKLARNGFRDVGFHTGDAGRGIALPDDSFDVAFLAMVIGEVSDQRRCLRSLARVVRPGGLLVLLEGFPDPDPLPAAALREMAEEAGFWYCDTISDTWHDVVRFRRPQ